MPLPKISEISAFLFQFKFFAQAAPGFSPIDRQKNIDSITDMGITVPQFKSIILKLTPKNYVSGPEKDVKYPEHDIWRFGYDFGGEELYIKLSGNFSHGVAKCISFHKAEFPMRYPYSEGGE